MNKKVDKSIRIGTSESGAALIVSLIILGVITVIGISNMGTANMQLKMVSHDRDRSEAFFLADAALSYVESSLGTILIPSPKTLNGTCNPASEPCFTSDCSGGVQPGLCFDGSWAEGSDEYSCVVGASAASGRRTQYWSDPGLDVWNKPEKHSYYPVPGTNKTVKYIVEFLCFVDPFPLLPPNYGPSPVGDPNGGEPLFRVTVFAKGDKNIAPVALQSTFIALCPECK